MSLESRLRKLEQAAGGTYAPDQCPHRDKVAVIVSYCDGEPVPPIPDEPRCPLCGQVHALILKETVVERRPPPAA